MTLLATGRQGWASLCRLASAAHASARAEDGGAPAVTHELIAEHADGLVMLLGPASDVGQAAAARRADAAGGPSTAGATTWSGIVIEVVDHLEHKSAFHAARLAELARDTRTPAVLSNAVRYLDPVDSPTAQVLDAARHLVPLGSPRLVPHNGRAYLASQQDMTVIARRVAVRDERPGHRQRRHLLVGETDELGPPVRPRPGPRPGHRRPAPAGDRGNRLRPVQGAEATAASTRSCGAATVPPARPAARAASAAAKPRRHARDRLDHELDIIAATGMAAYFLTVADVADRIRRAGIRCAIRGSGAGSLVNHLLGISAIDPLEHDLLMERFLSPVRNTLPDIDLDVESARRLDAYRIIFGRYGAERTACEGFPLSQLDSDDAEIAGVIKLDVLGVRMQSAMAHALTEIERTERERVDLDASCPATTRPPTR